jgi:uncharacterized damage-inducible protein DinB
MRTATAVACTIFVMTLSPAHAQAPAGNPVSASIRSSWDTAKRNLQQSAEIMPEADYPFRPVDTVRTFGQILAHVAGANYVFCSAAKGEQSPHAEDAFEKSATTRAQIIKAVADSVAYCDAAYAAVNDKTAGETIEMPFGMGKAARSAPLVMNANHVNEHYGNLVTYFRIKGIVPPSSR